MKDSTTDLGISLLEDKTYSYLSLNEKGSRELMKLCGHLKGLFTALETKHHNEKLNFSLNGYYIKDIYVFIEIDVSGLFEIKANHTFTYQVDLNAVDYSFFEKDLFGKTNSLLNR